MMVGMFLTRRGRMMIGLFFIMIAYQVSVRYFFGPALFVNVTKSSRRQSFRDGPIILMGQDQSGTPQTVVEKQHEVLSQHVAFQGRETPENQEKSMDVDLVEEMEELDFDFELDLDNEDSVQLLTDDKETNLVEETGETESSIHSFDDGQPSWENEIQDHQENQIEDLSSDGLAKHAFQDDDQVDTINEHPAFSISKQTSIGLSVENRSKVEAEKEDASDQIIDVDIEVPKSPEFTAPLFNVDLDVLRAVSGNSIQINEDEDEAPNEKSGLELLLQHTQRNHGNDIVFLDRDESNVLCKELNKENECSLVHHCFWSDSESRCRTELWAMTCDMTQVKKTCLKISNCGWTSRSRIKGRYCKQQQEELEEEEDDDDVDDENEEPHENDEGFSSDKSMEGNENMKCSAISSSTRCEAVEKCYWSSSTRKCRTQLWAMTCNMTQLKSTCSQLKQCGWTSRTKSRGRYCKERPQDEDDEDDEENEENENNTEDEEPQKKNICKRIRNQDSCEEEEECFWSETSKKCKIELWAMTCSMTQIKQTCLEIKDCAWMAPTSKRTKGKYCKLVSSDDAIVAEASTLLEKIKNSMDPDNAILSYPDAEPDQEETPEISTFRIGARKIVARRCTSLKSELHCDPFPHCVWGSSGCKVVDTFLPCDSTSLKSKCELLTHCTWTATKKSKGKYCFDLYYIDHPEEVEARCTKKRSKSDCEDKVGCQWTSTYSSGRFCERQVSLELAEAQLSEAFPSLEIGLLDDITINRHIETFELAPEESTDGDRVGCKEQIECQSTEGLATQFHVSQEYLSDEMKYNQKRCCSSHSDFSKMLEAINTHFEENEFTNWWVDKDILVGIIRLQGVLPPWSRVAAISVVSNSSKAIRTLMDEFNHGFHYRPYAITACGRSSSSKPITCHSLQKFPSSKTLQYYTVAHMDIDNGPELHIYPRIIQRAEKHCVSLSDSKPVPLAMVLPTQPCRFRLYGAIVRCPRYVEAYLDLKFDEAWRQNVFVTRQAPAPDWKGLADSGLDVSENPAADAKLNEKLFWMRKTYCWTG